MPDSYPRLYVDAGIETIRFRLYADEMAPPEQWNVASSAGLNQAGLERLPQILDIFTTGQLSQVVVDHFGRGESFDALAVLWRAAARLFPGISAAVLELSASGYRVVGIDEKGELKDNLLLTNPRCGSGSGINLDRILRKLALERKQVDPLLGHLCGEGNREARDRIPTRADRCGVFASSATISDKNQGIPLDFALATTLKSEVLKVCKHITIPFAQVLLCGGVFRWQFARDCAADYFSSFGVEGLVHDQADDIYLLGLEQFRSGRAQKAFSPAGSPYKRTAHYYPPFSNLRSQLIKSNLFMREVAPAIAVDIRHLQKQPVFLAIDAGSTMAKVVIACAESLRPLSMQAYSNSGDTVETLKAVFQDLVERGVEQLNIVGVGVTGSARYQIQKTLLAVYPQLAERITLLVENYAHVRGSVDRAREYLAELAGQGFIVNQDFCMLVDVGGEDTKISSIDLQRGDLYDNAMNSKCSAGTGSLLDTLVDLFDLDGIDAAVTAALKASKAQTLNATCAVFLLEHARKLQAEGCPRDEILASAVWTIVENMSRSLWPQILMPPHPLVLLHGQTMQSDPLPLAVTQRLQDDIGTAAYCFIPAYPGYRACLGLIRTLADVDLPEAVDLPLALFSRQPFRRTILQCKGAVCGDQGARCYRSRLSSVGSGGTPFSVHLGGCAAINELAERRQQASPSVRDSCLDIWNFQERLLPQSDHPDRLVIPRSFALTEWARFFASLFEPLEIPVHVDTPREADVLRGQAHFRIDTCAPHIGVTGQFLRLAEQSHGVILAPQIEFLPSSGGSLSRTCTINQGGFAGAKAIAEDSHPQSRIHLFHLDLKTSDPELLAHKLYDRLIPVYQHYDCCPTCAEFVQLARAAIDAQKKYKAEVADFAVEIARAALRDGQKIAIVMGREYILNPGVYDSHVGRLLRDKGYIGLPSYVFDLDYDSDYAYLYWRNAHMIASIAAAVSRRSLSTLIRHQGLKQVIARCEEEEDLLPLIQVSTFLCGPDSVTNPVISEIMKRRPFLRIQSDAAIKELAHLENRMNTYVQQLAARNSQRVQLTSSDGFDVEMLNMLTNRKPLNPKTDVICFPTLADNRPLLAVLRAAGFECLENYDENYCLETLIEQGRNVAGDSVCAPLAAVYGDVCQAIQRFQTLRSQWGNAWADKRLLIFNNKGLGPCRQGQYVETHKLFLQRSGQLNVGRQSKDDADLLVQFLVGHENEGFNTGFPGWVFLRGVQATILQGVLHQLLAEGATRCRDREEYVDFLEAYTQLKEQLNNLIEKRSAPGELNRELCRAVRRWKGLYRFVAFFAWGFHRNHLSKPLRTFRQRWCRGTIPESRIRIHIDGEAYMRTAQFEALHEALLEELGFGRFQLTYTPLWGFLEYKLAGMMMRASEGIRESRAEIKRGGSERFERQRRTFLRKKQKRYLAVSATRFFLRQVLAAPLYRAAGLNLPEPLTKVLERAKAIVATRRPGGELIPYLGEAALKLDKGYDLILNIAPEGCMVSSMGEVITPAIYQSCPGALGKIQPLFSQQGDIDRSQLNQALLIALGPEKLYGE
ncbi:MAG: hypothetical protein JXQ81_03435 [Desulfuromonadales bacterium]|nr:hypothetical protein [Desulfuromonadales bacterium]MBN2791541.1 hypothetical protein [Desulfuromonadales bacterium]